MKNIGILLILFFSYGLDCYSQTYQLKSVFEDKVNETYLSHWRKLENIKDDDTETFSLWGYQRYDESWTIAYEVEYFKGSAKETLHFLKGIQDFAEKYEKQDQVFTYLSGVKIKTMKNHIAVLIKRKK